MFFDSASCNAILLLGKESEAAQTKIDAFKKRIDESRQFIQTINKRSIAYNSALQDENKNLAQNIRERLKIYPYSAVHLTNDISAIQGMLASNLLADKDLYDAIELAITPDSKKPLEVDEVIGSADIEALYKQATEVLAATPSFSNTIKHLEENPSIERWVESGLHFHSDAGTCEFCGNQISQDRLESFRSHFSKDLADHKAKVQSLLDRVKAAEFKLDLPKVAEINPQFRQAYQVACEPLSENIKSFNDAVKMLTSKVEAKVADSRKAIQLSPLAAGLETSISSTINTINAVIKENNKLASNFVNARNEASKQAKNHFVQQAAEKLASKGWDRKKTKLIERSNRLSTFINRMQTDVDRLQAEVSQAQQGCEKINERLVSMLGSEAVQITVTQDSTGLERFQLVRKNGAIAKNLSDGERTAIAFSYFLTKLKELRDEDFKQTIVYIDDPISSLDSNHIFQVTAAINDLFFKKVIQPNGQEAWSSACRQLFISTHNFEFFNLIRELKPSTESAARLYLVKRLSNGQSGFCNMPNSLSRYGSEYQFLFDQLHSFHVSPNKIENESLLILPNVLRRFVELYTFSRIPSTQKETVDHRAIELFGKERAKSILKFLHTFSHGNTIERLAGNNELIFLLEETVQAVFEELQEKDLRHWTALVAAVTTHANP